MKNDGTPSMLKKAFLFLVTLLLLMVVSFFVGVYLGADNIREQPSVPASVEPITPPADKRLVAIDKPIPETRRLPSAETQQPAETTPEQKQAEPAAPEVTKPAAPESKPAVPEGKKTAPEAQAAPHKTVSEPQKPAADAKKAAPGKASGVYYVQVGAFKNLREAEHTVDKLRKKGFDAYMIEPGHADKTPMYKVRVGKYSNKPDADAAAEKLRKNEAVQAFVQSR